ncbi:CapA family protein, partial [Phytoactinopolyspora endophytica]|uniref:CapA family protein n=1 Tax=Phytoactinopolyspora endophytica TaxID=1642495 RepID=UPI0013EB7926
FVGDTGFGENYQENEERRGRGNVLKDHGYTYGFERFDPLLSASDVVVANLETPLTALTTSPFEGVRRWLHRSDPVQAPQALTSRNIGVVTLANNHTADYGQQGLLDTLHALDSNGIITVGAGLDSTAATRPFRARAELATGNSETPTETFRLRVYSAFRGGRLFRDTMNAYAGPDQPGCAPLRMTSLLRRVQQAKERRPDEFVVVCVHWRRDYQWRSDQQADVATRLTEAGADLVLGHGSHMMQEIEKLSGRWVVHGVGNFVFNSPGRYQKLGAPPYSLVTRLTVSHRDIVLRLYPIVTDNRLVRYQPRPVTEEEFEEVATLLAARSNVPDSFREEFQREHDSYGYALTAHLRR